MTTTERTDSPYNGHRIAVGTKHGKQRQLAPAFADLLGTQLYTPADLDTDQFGTFSGDRQRQGTALDAARAKVQLAMDASGLPYALSSEASYGPLQDGGCIGHEEILLFCDSVLDIEVIEGYRTTVVPAASHRVTDCAELPPAFLAGLPGQALIVRAPGTPAGIVKGITDAQSLRAAVAAAVNRSDDGLAIVEPDLRAHHNPTRRHVLTRLARTLGLRLATPCPKCAAPGFGRVGTEPGLPCRACQTPTTLPRWEIHQCCRCSHTVTRPAASPAANPADCLYCNP